MTQAKPHYTRILVKLSGEALLGESDYGIDPTVLKRIAGELQDIVQTGVQVAVVLGGGNLDVVGYSIFVYRLEDGL